MAALTKKEILAQLEKFGVSSASDLHIYFKEYEEYSTLQNRYTNSSQDYCDGRDNN